MHGRCAGGQGRFVDGGARPGDGEHVREFEQLPPTMPGVEFEDRIAADHPHQRRMRAEFVAQLAQRVDGVGRACAAQLAPVDDQSGLAVHRKREHLRPLLRIRVRRALVRRIGGGQQVHVGVQGIAHRARDGQVPGVDGVEGAAVAQDQRR